MQAKTMWVLLERMGENVRASENISDAHALGKSEQSSDQRQTFATGSHTILEVTEFHSNCNEHFEVFPLRGSKHDLLVV